MDAGIVHNETAQRFETTVEGVLCVLEYRLQHGVLAIDHVGVPDAVAGCGIAGVLTRNALDLARREHWRVIPNCSYVAVWIKRHPEYAGLVAA